MKLSTLCYSLILATSSSSVARVLANFEPAGDGECADANGDWFSWNNVRQNEYAYIDLATCQERCRKTLMCVGVTYTPVDYDLGIYSKCYTHAGTATPAVPVTTVIQGNGLPGTECYRYLPENSTR